MKIACLGGGPGGLYFAISMKLRNPSTEVVVFERNRPDDTFGWGVVLSDQTLDNLAENDPVSAQEIRSHFAYWDDLAIKIRGERVVSGGHGFCGIGRRRLLIILQQRARELGVDLQFSTEVASIDELKADYDIVVACDGLNSKTRNQYADVFKPQVDLRACKFVWLGTTQTFDDAFTFIFEETEHGWLWVHAYQFDQETATFIVECSEETFEAFGFGQMSQQESIAVLEEVFKDHLGGHPLMTNANHIRGSAWINFPRVICDRWSHDNIVLMGDAAATAHFSIGSGTKLALESSISLADLLQQEASIQDAFTKYESERRAQVLRIQSAALNSLEWFENIHRYLDFEPTQLHYAQLTRSQRIGHENLRLRDAEWLAEAEQWFMAQSGAKAQSGLPVTAPFELRNVTFPGRVMVEADQPQAWHQLRGQGVGCWLAAPIDLAQAEPVVALSAPSAIPVAARLTYSGAPASAPASTQLVAAFESAVDPVKDAGYTVLELDLTRDTLLGRFLLAAADSDADIQTRLATPLAVIRAVRAQWQGPLMVRWTADDVSGEIGLTAADAVIIAQALAAAGVDLQVPVTGVAAAQPPRGRMWGVPASDRVRNEAKVLTLATGGIAELDHANAILMAGRADFVGIHLSQLESSLWTGAQAAEAVSA
jgi:anthraniloyl-CoA monooxygenase